MYGWNDKPTTDADLYIIDLLNQVIRLIKEQDYDYASAILEKAYKLINQCKQ